MKKLFLITLTGLFILLCGCTSVSTGANEMAEMSEMEKLGWIIKQFDTANSIEWESVNYNCYQDEEGETVSNSHGETKYIKKPFVEWKRSVMDDKYMQQFVIEFFCEEKNGILTNSNRFSDIESNPDKPSGGKTEKADGSAAIPLTSWNTTSFTDITSDEKDGFIACFEMSFMQLPYLLNSNIDSFVPGRDILDGTACIKYDGHITPETVLDYYEKFGRDVYVQVGILEKKENMSREDLKNEILNAAITPPFEPAAGLNEILFSDNPASVSIWINETSGAVMSIKIDFTEARVNLTKLLDSNAQITVKENFIEYRNIVFDGIKTFKRPE